jgi:murein peptide amidase A
MAEGWSSRGATALAVAVGLAGCGHVADRTRPAGVRRDVPLGYSVRHRPIRAVELGDPGASRKVLIVGCVHGDETAGIAIARALASGPAVKGVDLWVVPDLNPDGVAARTRGNASGVDLNRNFPGWRASGHGSEYYSGRGPLSEPESRIAANLIRRIRPDLSIWFHQHMAVVDVSEGPRPIERRLARDVGLPTRRLTDYPGSVTGWTNTLVRDSAFVVELPAGELPAARVTRYAAAVRTAAA